MLECCRRNEGVRQPDACAPPEPPCAFGRCGIDRELGMKFEKRADCELILLGAREQLRASDHGIRAADLRKLARAAQVVDEDVGVEKNVRFGRAGHAAAIRREKER